jgi:hypothetical protein
MTAPRLISPDIPVTDLVTYADVTPDIGNPIRQNTRSLNARTRWFSFSTDIRVTVVGGKSTGAFAGASGPGAVQVIFAATAPRFTSGPNKGRCNFRGRPKTIGAVASFLGSLVLTVR